MMHSLLEYTLKAAHCERSLGESVDPAQAARQSMAKTARDWQKTGVIQSVYRKAAEVVRPGDEVLDFGSGPYGGGRKQVEEAGGAYFDHDPDHGLTGDLDRKYDVVLASNVLNVQSKQDDPESAYSDLLATLTGLVTPGGVLVANMPGNGPRAGWMTAKRLEFDLSKHFSSVSRTGDVVVARSPKC